MDIRGFKSLVRATTAKNFTNCPAEDIQTPLTKQARYLDKLVDELAKGKKMEKILRGS